MSCPFDSLDLRGREMEKQIQKTLIFIKGCEDGESTKGRCEVSATDASDVELLDAYSRAVTTVVEIP